MDTTQHAKQFDDSKPALTKPISIRFTKEEIAELKSLAGDLSVSEYIRRQLFGRTTTKCESASEMRLTPQARQKLLAQILMRLGRLDTTKKINLLMDGMQSGLVDVSPDAIAMLSELHQEIKALRRDLLKALGLRS